LRAILKKVKQQTELSPSEWERLLVYIENLGQTSGESYGLFRMEYGFFLSGHYQFFLPEFYYGADHLADFIGQNYAFLSIQAQVPLDLALFPSELHPYVKRHFMTDAHPALWGELLALFPPLEATGTALPIPRAQRLVTIYEESNPRKETGLRLHWQRLHFYSFITRLQSYRYLTKNKAKQDCFRVLTPEKLRGIYTNREKSIYYFVYLTEADKIKAQNACKLLNHVFYDS